MSWQEEYAVLTRELLFYLKEQSSSFLFSSQEDILFFSKKSLSTDTTSTKVTTPSLKNTIPSNEPLLDEMKTLFSKIAPDMPLISQIPSDLAAKQKKEWSDIIICTFKNSKEELHFLKDLAHALSYYFYPTEVVDAAILEQKKEWDFILSLSYIKMIIASDSVLKNSPSLLKHYKQIPTQGKCFLGNTPFFPINSLALFFKNPPLKIKLWQMLVKKLQSK
jgi:hypothetical protein